MPPATTSPHSGSGQQKAPLMRRQSSQSSQTSRGIVASPGSADQPLRHAPVKAARRTKIVLPRNHSSARDLAKLARQTQAQHPHRVSDEEARRRQRSHEGDTEIRLPGSLDESKAQAQPMRRNLTAYQLPRNTSHTKLKKNLSHGQLTRIGSGKNLAGLNEKVGRGPPSPGLKNRKNRPKSADMGVIVKDMQQQEEEVAQERAEEKEAPKKVGFAVGSSGDSDEEAPDMEGSGLQEDEWTDQSASASPYSTRQNTANNSRRASMTLDKPPDKRPLQEGLKGKGKATEQIYHAPSHLSEEVKGEQDDDEEESESESDTPPSPRSQPHMHVHKKEEVKAEEAPQQAAQPQPQTRSLLHGAKEHPNPATRYLLGRRPSAAHAQLSVNEGGESSAQASPAPSMRSSRSNIGDNNTDQDQEELVSRFIPSGSHPSSGSVGGTTVNTPKTGSFQTPESESILASRDRSSSSKLTSFQLQTPTSPGSTVSASSGATTPAMSRSRTEMRMMNEKAVADLEDAAARNPAIPSHVFDRRNVSLKTHLSAQSVQKNENVNPNFSVGPDIFSGRFKAVNVELKVVQRYRDPIAESVRRLDRCKAVDFTALRGKRAATPTSRQTTQQPAQAGRMPISRSAVALNRGPSNLSTSTTPPRSGGAGSPVKPALNSAKSAANVRSTESRRGNVRFSVTPPELHEGEDDGEGVKAPPADAIARMLWESV